jgi:protein-S-isoprenylcysteine O-methyltransferase Ste14
LARDLVLLLWLIWAGYWIVAAQSSKPDRRRESAATRLPFLAQMLVTAVLLAPLQWRGWWQMPLIGGGWTRFWWAIALIAAGLAFSVWARHSLAGNWSGSVVVKEGHELVQSGPYRWIRHPIYTGLILMIIGTGLASGRMHGLLAFPIASIGLWLKSRVEERWMEAQFGERYAAYRARSWALIPLVL